MAFTVYIIKCSDDTLYTGYTSDLEKRLEEHNESKKGAKYTRSRRPVTLIYTEHFRKKESAMRREAQIKKLSRKDKKKLFKELLTKL